MGKGQPAMKLPCGLSLLSIGLFMLLAVTASEAATLARLRVGYPSPSASFFALFATKEAGLLEKYGFDTEMVYVQGVQLVHVHVAGQLDVSTISSVVYLQASVEGADLIQVASSIDNQLMKLMVHPSIAKPEDLRGKTLAVTRFGSLTDLLIRPVLKNWDSNRRRM
jgi:NitT/TauT family transport system substrate-binding protein